MSARALTRAALAVGLAAALAGCGVGRTPAPSGAAGHHLTLPPVRRATLPNGLVVLVMPTHRLPLVDFRLVVRAGAVDDPGGREGLANLTATLLTQGAGRRGAKQIAEDIAFVGGTLDASAGAEQIVVTAEVLTPHVASGLELFHDVVVAPTFPAEEFARKKAETLGAIASEKDDPAAVANNELGPFLLGHHPLAHPVEGWAKSVGALTRADVVAFHRQRVTPANAVLAIVGDVDPDSMIAALGRAFADWKGGPGPAAPAAAPYGAPDPVRGRRVLIVSKPEVTQTQIRLATLGVPRNTPDYFPIVVANTILGGGFTSRLVNQIRVVQGLTYDISSGWRMYRNAGTYVIDTFTRNETLRKAIDSTLAVVGTLVDAGPTQAELDKAKRYLTGQFPLGLQAPDELAAQLLTIEFYGLDPHYLETYADHVNAVTLADVRRVLKDRFGVGDLRILVVSNPDSASAALAGLGPIAVQPLR
jgi:zinc protease